MRIKHNVIYGVLGFIVPTLVMLLSIPILISGLGKDGFGVFMLAASVGGSFAFLDMGLSSATTKYVAEDMAQQKVEDAGATIKTSLAFYSAIAFLVVTIVWILAPFFPTLFSIPIAMGDQAITAFRVASLQFGIFMLVSVYLSLFKALHRFDIASIVNTYTAVISYAGAALAVWLGFAGLVGATYIGLFACASGLCIAYMAALRLCRESGIDLKKASASIATLRRVLGFSAILTAHSFAAVFFAQVQRLIVGNILGPAAVTIYQVAYAAASKSHSLVNAAAEVLFPIVSALQNHARLQHLHLRMLAISAVVAILILAPLALLAQPIVTLWVGRDIALSAAPILQILAIAFFFVAISAPTFHVINGLGRPGINVLYSVSNVCLYIAILWWISGSDIVLTDFAWAFAASNAITGIVFQLVAMRLITQLSKVDDGML